MQFANGQGPSETTNIENVDFETAVEATGFGCFTILFMCITVSGGWATWFSVSVMSYVSPVAECDLNLSIANKGQLNAITYVGMMATGLLMGYLADTLGRRILIIILALLDIIFVLLAAISQTFAWLITAKFVTGCIVNGVYVNLVSYTSEILKRKYRPRFMLMQAMFNVTSLLILPVLAFLILPKNYDFEMFKTLEIKSWGIFVAVTAFPSVITFFGGIWLDESPKFYMATGRNDKALKGLQRVYAINTRKPASSFPIKSLMDEVAIRDLEGYKHGGKVTANRSAKLAIKEGFQQFRPLFFPPFRKRVIMVIILNFLVMFSTNSLRLWLPEMFKNIFLQKSNKPDVCYALQKNNSPKQTKSKGSESAMLQSEQKCETTFESNIYYYLMIVSATAVVLFCVSGIIINQIGSKILLISCTSIASICAITLYFVRYGMVILTMLLCVCVSLGTVSITLVVTLIVELVPTHLRTMLLSIAFLFGRCGAMTGNFVLPFFIKNTGCVGPFALISCGFLGATILSAFLPKPDTKPFI